MFKLKKIKPLSAAKISTLILAFFGLILGIVYSAIGIMINRLPTEVLTAQGLESGSIILFKPVMILIMPILYAIIGFISGLVGAWIYNLAARWVGGIEIELVK